MVEIRDFIPKDQQQYLALSREFYESSAVLHTIPDEHFQKTFALSIEGDSPYLRGLAITVDGEMAGYGLLSFTYSNEAGGLTVLMEEAYILPRYQGRGLGTRLFSFVENAYVKTGRAKRLRLEVSRTNNRAISLYVRQGFERLDYIQMIRDF